MSKQKENSSKPDGGPHVPKGKKMTSNPQGDGKDGKAGNLNGKDTTDVRDAYRENSRPSEWNRKSKKSHADAKASKAQGGA